MADYRCDCGGGFGRPCTCAELKLKREAREAHTVPSPPPPPRGSYDCASCGPFNQCSCERGALKRAMVAAGGCDKPLGVDVPDPVNHPTHYIKAWGEVIDITEQLNFNLGNVVKYVLRCDDKGKPEEDLKKAQWYLARELKRRGYT